MDSTVFVNGKTVGEWKYGYSTFEFDITDYLVPGENDIRVRVVYQSPNSRWYSGRAFTAMWLITRSRLILYPTASIFRPGEGRSWKVEVDAEMVDKSGKCGITAYAGSGGVPADAKGEAAAAQHYGLKAAMLL